MKTIYIKQQQNFNVILLGLETGARLGSEKHFSFATFSYSNFNSYYINYLGTTLFLSAMVLAVIAKRIKTCNFPNHAKTLSCWESKSKLISATNCKIKITQQKHAFILELKLSIITDLVILQWH